MSYRRIFFLHPVTIATIAVSMIISISTRVAEIVFAPVAYLINALPAPAEFSILPRFNAVAFVVINRLKPVYRESFLTNGHSLDPGMRPT